MAKRPVKTFTHIDPEPLNPVGEESPRRTVEVLEPFVVNGEVALEGDTVENLTAYLANNLVERGRAAFKDGAS